MHEKLSATPEGKALLKVITAAGGQAALAAAIGVRKQSIYNWVYLSPKGVSKAGAIAIEKAFPIVTKEQLRPDVIDWSMGKNQQPDRLKRLESTACGEGLLLVLERACYSCEALAMMLGLSGAGVIGNWIARGYVPKHNLKAILQNPEFEGITAEMIRPDLHEMDY